MLGYISELPLEQGNDRGSHIQPWGIHVDMLNTFTSGSLYFTTPAWLPLMERFPSKAAVVTYFLPQGLGSLRQMGHAIMLEVSLVSPGLLCTTLYDSLPGANLPQERFVQLSRGFLHILSKCCQGEFFLEGKRH